MTPDPRDGDPLTLVEDHGYPLISVQTPNRPLTTSEIRLIRQAYGLGLQCGQRERRLAPLVLVGLIGMALGFLLSGRVLAAPRPDLVTTPQPGASVAIGSVDAPARVQASTSPGPTGVPSPSGPERSQPTADSAPAGIASFMAPSYGDAYLALPAGPGHRVRICSSGLPDRCIERTSTDSGPDLAMQRDGRIADLSFADFKRVCRCDPWVVGLVDVTIEELGS